MLSPTVVFLILLLTVVSHGTFCGINGLTFSCRYGCCGDPYHPHCCSGDNAETTATVALNIGIVCSAVLTVVVIVMIVVCCVRCCRRSKGHQGQVISTSQPMAVITTSGRNITTGAYNAGYVYPPQPAPGIPYTQPAGTAPPPPSYPPGPACPTETEQAVAEQAKTTQEGAALLKSE